MAYAEPGGKTEQFCGEVLAWGKPLCTLESDANANLMVMGAQPVAPGSVQDNCLRGVD